MLSKDISNVSTEKGNSINSEQIKWVTKNDSFAKFKINNQVLEDVLLYQFDLDKNSDGFSPVT